MSILDHCPTCPSLAIDPALDEAGASVCSMIESADGAQGLAFVVDAAGRNCIAYHSTADEAHTPRFVYGSPEALVREAGRLLKSLGFDEQEGPYWAARHRLQEVS